MHIPILGDIFGKKENDSPVMFPSHNINFSSSDNNYPESLYRHQSEIRKVNSKEGMKSYVENSNLTRQCKNALLSEIENLYDDNVILSYHSDEIRVEVAYYLARIRIESYVKANSWKSDVMNPVFALVSNELLYQLQARLTRTIGGKERAAQGRIVQRYEFKQGVHGDESTPQSR